MALSDAEAYYQAGTIASALLGLSKTVANAEQTADQYKAATGPNPVAVTIVRESAASRPAIITPAVIKPSGVVKLPGTFKVDDAGDALRNWLRPGGAIDANRVKTIRDFIAEKKLSPVPQVTTFLRSATYAIERAELARRLGLI